jgi:rSAM/selenodomain-associated transferase 2
MPALSVIIPTLNEASELPETLKRARAIPEVKEIIVVDAGSTDDTQAIARDHNCIVIESKPSRGKQLRLGAQRASGDVVLFLHADTWLPENAGVVIAETLARPLVVAGGFYKRFRDGGALPGSRLRCWLLWALTNRLFGDQAIFVKREVLENCGGVPDVPLMEEFELCKTIARNGRIKLAPATVLSSARKFRDHGTFKTYWLMSRCIVRYWLGASPQRLAKIYYEKNTDKHDIQDEKLLS